jgi:hypothetical protein
MAAALRLRRLLFPATLALLAPIASSWAQNLAVGKACDYAGQAFSVGATVCECPGLEAENLNWQKERGHITSRRLVCGPQLTWDNTKTMCIDVKMETTTAETYGRWVDQYCPRLPVNFAEIQKAVSQETTKYVDAASKSAITSMVEAICKRYRIEAPCKALLDAINSPGAPAQK